MNTTLAIVLAAIVLSGPFEEAAVEGTQQGAGMRIDFEVAVGGEPTAVVVHVVNPGETQETVSLTDRGGGIWGSVADLDLVNYVAVFEVLYADGEGEVSDPATLLELGLDPAILGMGEVTVEGGDSGDRPLSPTTLRWGWGAVALVAVALALLAVWAMGDRDGVSDAGEKVDGDSAAGDQSTG
jgi:hypothetical protein